MPESDYTPIYVATGEFLAELRELGYEASIELDDLIDFLDEDPSYIEQMRPAIILFDEMNYLSPIQVEFLYGLTIDGRPT
jgi:hypothetical protein